MGLLSYVYADVAPADPRMRAAQAWLEGHYSVAGHPAMGMDSYYFYMLALTKALKVLAIDPVQTPAGPRPWKKEAAARLVSLQKGDGSWSNDAGRWWENDPNLASAYAMQALEFCL
jgi:squalene-hopene/tetraprenyl-beta-curcumene cyclase